jgi:hypothetical protein
VSDENPDRTALYRIRDEDDALIYIGITTPGIPFRWNGHQAIQPWWDEVRSLTVEWFDTRAEAEAAEKAAILAEQPKYNVTYLKPGRGLRGRRAGSAPVDWENFALEPEDDDDDMINISEVATMIRMQRSTAKAALRSTGGPRGFKLGPEHLFRTGQIRRWIAAVEASQCGDGPSVGESDESEADAA